MVGIRFFPFGMFSGAFAVSFTMIMRRNGLSDQERNPLHLAGSQPPQRTPFPEIAGFNRRPS